MRKKLFLGIAVSLLFVTTCKAQFLEQLSFQALVGWSGAQGGLFKNSDGEKLSSFGVNYDLDVLYHFNQLNNKLGVGLGWNSSFLFAADFGDGISDIGAYKLNLIGAKGYYRFFTSKVSPYASLLIGASEFLTPEMTITIGNEDPIVIPKESAWGLGIRPELGVALGDFIISAAYIVPMNYNFSGVKDTAGALEISIGYRKTIFHW